MLTVSLEAASAKSFRMKWGIGISPCTTCSTVVGGDLYHMHAVLGVRHTIPKALPKLLIVGGVAGLMFPIIIHVKGIGMNIHFGFRNGETTSRAKDNRMVK